MNFASFFYFSRYSISAKFHFHLKQNNPFNKRLTPAVQPIAGWQGQPHCTPTLPARNT
jgi:hypothetical protein